MGLNLTYDPGQTPLDEEEKEGLRISSISTRGELDEFEQQNIEEALQWSLTRRINPGKILTEGFIREVHKRMYGNVWAWAGDFRKTEKNLGIKSPDITVALKALLDDVIWWVAHQTYEPDDIAIRFKHRLVSIHCFPNGNGRHSRLMADLLISVVYKRPVFTWGIQSENARETYLKAIRKADKGEYDELIRFARS